MKTATLENRLGGALAMLCSSLATIAAAEELVDWPQLRFTQVVTGVAAPTCIAVPPDGTGRMFVTEQSGRVMLIQGSTVTPFLNLEDRVQFEYDKGLLGVAFPPGFATNRHFYAFYDALPDGATTISRFRVPPSNLNAADPSTEEPLLVIPTDPFAESTLSGGSLLFGPDGFLYVGVGDGGFGQFSTNQAQNARSFRGKILRLDVESAAGAYRIPGDNPFVGNPEFLPEIWALGMRNPWRFSFDPATGDFYMGDVGQLEFEEVNFESAARAAGQNYGWPIREGQHLYAGPEPARPSLTDPVIEFPHVEGPASVTGGLVCRGAAGTRMNGLYLYAEAYSGTIFALARVGANWLSQRVGQRPYFITTFGENEAGELFLADYISGTIYRIEDNGEVAAPVFDPPGTNSFTGTITLTCLSPNAIIRYTTNGIDPGPGDAAVNSGGTVSVGPAMTLKARAYRNDLLPSPVTSMSYDLKTARPTFNPPLGPVTNGHPIAIMCPTPGATIRFSTDGSDPTVASALYSNPITYSDGMILKARAFKSGFADSAVAVFSPLPVVIKEIYVNGAYTDIIYQSISGWTFQMQVAEDVGQWRNLRAPQPGVEGLMIFNYGGGYPLPMRQLYRLKAFEDP